MSKHHYQAVAVVVAVAGFDQSSSLRRPESIHNTLSVDRGRARID
jgi:hypothetical protein